MSIIHDALKKAQANFEHRDQKKTTDKPIPTPPPIQTNIAPPPEAAKPVTSFRLASLIFILLVAAVAAVLYYYSQNTAQAKKSFDSFKKAVIPQPASKQPAKSNTAPAAANATFPVSKPGLKLEGTMMMGAKRVALINGETYQIGEKVNGMEIINITLTKVILKDGENVISIGAKE